MMRRSPNGSASWRGLNRGLRPTVVRGGSAAGADFATTHRKRKADPPKGWRASFESHPLRHREKGLNRLSTRLARIWVFYREIEAFRGFGDASRAFFRGLARQGEGDRRRLGGGAWPGGRRRWPCGDHHGRPAEGAAR